jgi:hypothetical protein
MDLLKRLNSLGFSITWRLLLIGWNGPAKFGRVVTADDIIAYATDLIGSPKGSYQPEITELAAAQRNETDVVEACLRRLSGVEGTAPGLETRKWRYVLLEQLMEKLPRDPVQGLTELTTFWEQFDFPADSPHLVQGKGNRLSPEQYYTITFLNKIVLKHKAWMENERRLLAGDAQ